MASSPAVSLNASPWGPPPSPGNRLTGMSAGSPTPAASPMQAAAAQGPTVDQVKEATHQVAYLNQSLKELLNKPGGASRSDVIDAAGEAISEGVMSPQQAAQELASLPDTTGAIRAWLQQHVTNTDAARGALIAHLARRPGQQPQPQPQSAAMPLNALTRMSPYGQ